MIFLEKGVIHQISNIRIKEFHPSKKFFYSKYNSKIENKFKKLNNNKLI